MVPVTTADGTAFTEEAGMVITTIFAATTASVTSAVGTETAIDSVTMKDSEGIEAGTGTRASVEIKVSMAEVETSTASRAAGFTAEETFMEAEDLTVADTGSSRV
jgi:hypothetical protein